MRAKHEIKPITTIAITVIISSIILASTTFLFYSYIMPMYSIGVLELYQILVRLLPLIVGLILTIIALVVAPVYIPHTSSKDDELPIDHYTAPLYNLPDEDKKPLYVEETEKVEPSKVQASVVEEKVAPVKNPYREKLEPVTPLIKFDVDTLMQEPIVVKEEIPFVHKEVASQEIDSSLDRAVLFSDYPFSITKESDIASLLEPIEKSIPVDLSEFGDIANTIEDRLEERLGIEIVSAQISNYCLSLAVFDLTFSDNEEDNIVDTLYEKMMYNAYLYTKDNYIYAIYPFYSYKQCQMSIARLIKTMKKIYPLHQFAVGFTSITENEFDTTIIIEQAHTALSLAVEQERDSIIGFEVST